MIATEEIELARVYTARLTEDDKALVLVKLDPEGNLRIFQAGDDESTDSLLQKLSCWVEQLRSGRRGQI